MNFDNLSPGALEVFLEGLAGGNPSDAIERQEARGGREVQAREMLPKECNGCTRAQLEAMGIVFGADVDDLFVEATLPAGWRKEGTGHSMHTRVLDAQGRERASIFYKAAIVERSAYISISRRFSAGAGPSTGYGDGYNPKARRCGYVTDQGAIIYRTPETVPHDNRDYQREDALGKQARAWLEGRYPDWQNPLAYWDEA